MTMPLPDWESEWCELVSGVGECAGGNPPSHPHSCFALFSESLLFHVHMSRFLATEFWYNMLAIQPCSITWPRLHANWGFGLIGMVGRYLLARKYKCVINFVINMRVINT